MTQVPIIFLGDTPDRAGGLSRITKDIAGQLSRNPKFRVATLGREALGSRKLPWQQYAMRYYTSQPDTQWGAGDLRRAWEDFAGKERGVVLTIYDPTRTLWLSRPEFSGDQQLAQWLAQDHFDLWGYITLDATGPQDRLSEISRASLLGYRRLLGYTKWSAGLIERSISQPEASKRHLDWLPHGLDLPKWPLRDKRESREKRYPFLHEGERLIGAIGTNQPRKDWGLIAMTCQMLLAKNPRTKLWFHTDLLERSWSFNALLADFGLSRSTIVTTDLSQDELSWWYNACDLTLHPGLGEGFGYPIFESLASGTPALHGDYAGGADVLRQCGHASGMLVPAQGYRLEGISNQIRPVYDPTLWLEKAEALLEEKWDRDGLRASVCHLSWENLYPSWERWFEEGIA